MKFQIGDKVLVKHSDEEGEIIDFIDTKMALVQVKNVNFPVYLDQLDFPYFKRFTEKKLFPEKKEKKYVEDIKPEKVVKVQGNADGLWVNFLPKFVIDEFGDDLVTELKVYLINRTHDVLDFKYELNYTKGNEFALKNTIQPFENFYLHDIPFEDLNDSPVFDFEFSLVKPDKVRAEYVEASLKLKARQVFTRIEKLKEQNEAHFSYSLLHEYPARKSPEPSVDLGKLKNKGFKVYEAKDGVKHLPPARSVIDLHIEKLVDDYRRMPNHEIIDLQLKTFETYYELAVLHHLPSFIVVHGIGEGVLRNEIHDLLRLKKEVKSFVNQYDSRFGFGATEIFFA